MSDLLTKARCHFRRSFAALWMTLSVEHITCHVECYTSIRMLHIIPNVARHPECCTSSRMLHVIPKWNEGSPDKSTVPFPEILRCALDDVKSISIITPPAITEKIVEAAIKKGIENIWMQPGAESKAAIQNCLDNHINIIAGGPCLLVILGYNE